ncbi:MAG: peptidylprolyl isomerase [Solirubrobacterales bacterium]|nr:peptidylprolyl isomerase [Solirubrobacterales bacterium]
MLRPLALLMTVSALGLSACGESSGDDVTPPPSAPAASTPATPETAPPAEEPSADASCVKSEEPGGEKALPCPTQTVEEGKTNVVSLETSEGDFDITLDVERAPETANSVAYLAKEGFYDGLDFHRVVPDFVIQGGDPNGDGSGGPGYSVTEAPPSDLTYTRGLVAMAKAGNEPAGASGSQFFVVSAPDVGLPPEYALVGKVDAAGMKIVDKITALGEGDGPPSKKVTIEKATFSAE